MTIGISLRSAVAGGAAALALSLAPAAHAGVSVCNEAANAQKGDLTVSGGIVDPNPPARFLDGRWTLSGGNGNGLVNAADRSPALRQCAAPVVDPGSGDGSRSGDGSGSGSGGPVSFT